MTKDQAEIARYSLMEKGRYKAVIKKQESKTSKSGNPMMEVILEVYDNSGDIHQVKDYWVFSKKMMWKVIHSMEACGLLKEYENKTFQPYMVEEKCVDVMVGIQKGQEIPFDKLGDRPLGSCYPDKNCIDDYVVDVNVKPASSMPLNAVDKFNDDIPF
ncbi:MAG TPA: DUF669 domain-containing protein [Candidatus Nitrosopolaris rasttigaisensis]|nr:DUF669 domain-containing protein [Candidatus Nitrosopolaris rasttigaisensis]